ncbi:hypothetical protein [Geitlerinema sp. P-1104]|uniref:hypothetical protein n=1 Tax=Geitlerinema sp. P-1104 TaxID=2546230 RepID=UPI00336C0F40
MRVRLQQENEIRQQFQFLKGILGDCEDDNICGIEELEERSFQFLKGILGDCEYFWVLGSPVLQRFQFLKGILGDCEPPSPWGSWIWNRFNSSKEF